MQWKTSLKGSVTVVYLTILMAESKAMEAIQENGWEIDWVSCRNESTLQLLKPNLQISKGQLDNKG